MQKSKDNFGIGIAMTLVMAASSAQAVVLHVDSSAPAGGDGYAWQTCLNDLQAALDIASIPQNEITEIRLAKGMYIPTARIDEQDPRSVTFQLRSGLAIRGGFAGWDAPDPDARDVSKFVSVLSGDLNGDDGPAGSWINYTENAYHVVISSSTDKTAVLDGVTITAGSGCCDLWQLDPNGFGGGLHCISGSPTLIACTISYCRGNRGGGVYIEGGAPQFLECQFIGNAGTPVSNGGGAVYVLYSLPTFTNCTFVQNSANLGGAIVQFGETTSFDGCAFYSNFGVGDSRGGAIYCAIGRASLTDCVVSGNSSETAGGAIYLHGDLSGNVPGHEIALDHCTFSDNSSEGSGGAIQCSGGSLIASSCQFANNLSVFDGGAVSLSSTTANLQQCTFQSNGAAFNGGALRIGKATTSAATASIVDCWFEDNVTGFSGAGGGSALRLVNMQPLVSGCVFLNNRTTGKGGGIWSSGTIAAPQIVNCLFDRNRSSFSSSSGSAIHNDGNQITIVTSTFVSNQATEGTLPGATVFNTSAGSVAMHNSIVWASTPAHFNSSAAINVNYSNVQGGWPGSGVGNMNADPKFGDPAAGDYTIAPTSPCIDAGDNASCLPKMLADLDGNPRFVDDPATRDSGNGAAPLVDIGCYEFQPRTKTCPGDITSDGIVGVPDLLLVIANWGASAGLGDINGDGLVNAGDLLSIISHWGPCS
jgi:predicted outer membrane repeat protein